MVFDSSRFVRSSRVRLAGMRAEGFPNGHFGN